MRRDDDFLRELRLEIEGRHDFLILAVADETPGPSSDALKNDCHIYRMSDAGPVARPRCP